MRRRNKYQVVAQLGWRTTGVAFFLLLAQAATAASPWQLRAMPRADDQPGNDYCVVERRWPDGRRFSLAQDRLGRINLGIVARGQRWVTTSPMVVTLTLDGQESRDLKGRGTPAGMLVIDLDTSSTLLSSLANARHIQVRGTKLNLTFALNGSAAGALGQMNRCAEQAGDELGRATLALLNQAGVGEGAEPVPPPPVLAQVGFAWRRGALIGGAGEFSAAPDFKTAVRGQLAVLQNYCQGLWSEEPALILVKGQARQQSVTISCARSGYAEHMGVIFHDHGDGAGKLYVLTGGDNSEGAIRNDAQAIANALWSAR